MSTVPEVRVGDHGRRPLLVFGSYPLFQRLRLEWSPEDRERARWVRDENMVRGIAQEADYIVLDGYSTAQGRAIVLASRRGLRQQFRLNFTFGDEPPVADDLSAPARITLPCLSIRQPWAWAILRAGKTIENRSWFTNYRGPMLLHASKGCTKAEWLDAAETIVSIDPSDDPVPELSELERGGIVGACQLYGMLPPGTGNDPWHAFGQYGWRLGGARSLKFRPLKGKQGLFRVELTASEVIDLRLDGLLEKVKKS